MGDLIVKEEYVADGKVGKVEEIFIYKPTDHELIDKYLGIYGTDHHVAWRIRGGRRWQTAPHITSPCIRVQWAALGRMWNSTSRSSPPMPTA